MATLSDAAARAASMLLRTIDAAKLSGNDPIERAADMLRREMPAAARLPRSVASAVMAERIALASADRANDDAPAVAWYLLENGEPPQPLPDNALFTFRVSGGIIAVARSEIGAGITVWVPPGGGDAGLTVIPVSEEAIAVRRG